jgi:hypothetical protein
MADEKSRNQNGESAINLTPDQLKSILVEAVTAAKGPSAKEAETQRAMAEARARTAQAAADRKAKEQSRCIHRRTYRGERYWKIAWMRNSDGVWRGVCQICSTTISPENLPQQDYARLVQESLDAQTAGSAALNQDAIENRRKASAV